MTRVLAIQGHPDAREAHLCHMLAQAYVCAAEGAGHQVRKVEVAELKFPLLTSKRDWMDGEAPKEIADAQQNVLWADHLFIAFPLWFGDMPALLKAFLEQLLRPRIAFTLDSDGRWQPMLSGKTARIVATTNVPARWGFHSDGLHILEQSILAIAGVRSVGANVIGSIDMMSEVEQHGWLARMYEYGNLAS